jgi:hypothetical protein
MLAALDQAAASCTNGMTTPEADGSPLLLFFNVGELLLAAGF